jgi:hypothetical protein
MPPESSLDIIVDPLIEEQPNTPNELACEEKGFYDENTHRSDLRRITVKNAKLNLKLRRKYAKYILWMTAAWMLLIYILLLLEGFGFWGFHLSDAIMLTAIGSTTANVVGMLYIIVNYFFQAETTSKGSTNPSPSPKRARGKAATANAVR